MYTAQNLVNNIKYIAKKKNILIRDILKDCGLSVNAINTISDKKGLSSFSLAKIADYLDCSVDYLLGRTDTPQVVNLPEPLISTLLSEYGKNSDEFISDDFIKEPPKSLIGQKYCFNASDYDKYQHIFDVAYKYTQENNIDILEVTGVDKEKYTDMVEYHSDIIEQIFTGKYAPPDSSQENNSISFDHGGETDSPEQEAGRIELQTRLLYVYPLGFQA